MRRSLPILALWFWMAAASVGFGQDIFVESAFYGREGYGIDVTGQVQELANRVGEIYVSNRTFGEDPVPGRRKYLTVTYIVDGRRFTQRVEENRTFHFQAPETSYFERQPPRVYPGQVVGRRPGYPYAGDEFGPRRIVRAVYGTRGRYVDVTEMVRRFAWSGGKFQVSNETFGVDPYKGRSKKLRVVYAENGRTFEKQYDEGDRVRLP